MGEWEWMCEWMYDFTMTVICTDSGLWGKMLRAWPAMSSMMTSSGSTWQSHQESAWRVAQARKDGRSWMKGQCWSWMVSNTSANCFFKYCLRWEGLQSRQALRSRQQPSRMSPTTLDSSRRGRGLLAEYIMFGEWVWMGEWEWMCEWMYHFTMTIICADSGLWGKMWRAWPPVSVMKTSSGPVYHSHQESTLGAAERRKDWWSWFRLLERSVLLGNVGVFVEHVYQLFFFWKYCLRRGRPAQRSR